MYDVFFSYRRSDSSRAEPLLSALAEAGVRVWRDEIKLRESEPVTPAIRDAIAQSKALIAFYSTEYPLSRACFEELSTAWTASELAGQLPHSRVFVINPEADFTHIASVLREQHSFAWPRYGQIAARIRALVEDLNGTLHRAGVAARTPYHGMSSIEAARFEGRSRELWELHGQLTANRMSIITGVFGSAAAQVRGMGGNGKSMLAREYAIRFGAAYPGGVFWLNAYGNDDSKGPLDWTAREAFRLEQIREFARRCKVNVSRLSPEQVETAFWTHLEKSGEQCLWILDDLPSGMAVAEVGTRWAAPWSGASTLITTRSSEYGSLGRPVDLEMLSEDEAFRLLTWRRVPVKAAAVASARQIVRKLGCHPLAIEVAGGYLARGFRTYEEYLAAFAGADSEAEDFGARLKEALPTGHERSISSTLLRSVRMLGADGRAFLELAAVLAVAPIPIRLVRASFAACSDRTSDAEAGIEDAASLGLARRDGEDGWSVHTLVSRAVRRLASDGGQRTRSAVVALIRMLPEPIVDRRHHEIQRELVHARHLVAGGVTNSDLANLAEWVGRHDSERGAYAAARAVQEQILATRRQLLGEDDPDTLTAMNNLAETMQNQGEFAGVRLLQERVLAGRLRKHGEENRDTLTAIGNLAWTIYSEGDLAAARALQQRVRDTSERVLGPEDKDTLRAMNNLAQMLQAQGAFAGAQEILAQALEVSRRVAGEEDRLTLTIMNNLALALQTQGRLAEARSLQQQVVEANRRLLPVEHPESLKALCNLALTIQAEGDLAAAGQLLEKALTGMSQVLGPVHPDTSHLAAELFTTLYQLGDQEAAHQIYRAFFLPLLGKNPAELSIAQRTIVKRLNL